MAAKRTWDSELARPVDVLTVPNKRLRTLRDAAGVLQVEHKRIARPVIEHAVKELIRAAEGGSDEDVHAATEQFEVAMSSIGMLAPMPSAPKESIHNRLRRSMERARKLGE